MNSLCPDQPDDSTTWPFVTVVMPVRNEAAYIDGALGSVLDQDYPRDCYEVVVSDGMSSDDTQQIAQQLSSGRDVRIIDNPAAIAPTGLNEAIRVAKGDVIVRVDGHCEVPRDYLRNCVSLLRTHDCEGVGGPIETVGQTVVAKAIAVAMSSRLGVGGSSFRTVKNHTLWADTVPFPAYRREVFHCVGLYDEELVRNQDDEFNARIRKAGGRLLLSPILRSRYYSRSSLSSLARQYYQYGYWKIRVLQKHPRQMSPRHFAPGCFLLTLAVLCISATISSTALFGLIIAVLAYLLLCVSCSAWAAIETGWRHAALLPFIFATLHVSYGLGFLAGLWAFRNRWRDRDGKAPRMVSTTAQS